MSEETLHFLESETNSFDFFQAVRLLSLNALQNKETNGGRTLVKFSSPVTLAFPSGEVLFTRISGQGSNTLQVNFCALAAASGPLPDSLTESIVQGGRESLLETQAFFDIFQGRFLWHLFHAAQKKWPVLAAKEDIDLERWLNAVTGGVGMGKVSPQIPPVRRAQDHLMAPRSRTSLERYLTHRFKRKIKIQNYIGEWQGLAAEQQTKIGLRGQENVLGKSAVLGCRVWLQDAGIALHVQEITSSEDLAHFFDTERFLLRELLAKYFNEPLKTLVHLPVRAGALPQATLGRFEGGVLGRSRLRPMSVALDEPKLEQIWTLCFCLTEGN